MAGPLRSPPGAPPVRLAHAATGSTPRDPLTPVGFVAGSSGRTAPGHQLS